MIPVVDAAFAMMMMFQSIGCYQYPIRRDMSVEFVGMRLSLVSYHMWGETKVYINEQYYHDNCAIAGALAFHSSSIDDELGLITNVSDQEFQAIREARTRASAQMTACCEREYD